MWEVIYDILFYKDWSYFLFLFLVLLLASELGFRFGRRYPLERRKTFRSQSGILQGALLGLLGLLLGFTFAMSINRFETRKQLVLDESNSIGTTWLRAAFLNYPGVTSARHDLEKYVAVRLEAAGQEAQTQPEKFAALVHESEAIQTRLWRQAVKHVHVNNTPAMSLYVSSLNEMIDLDAKRQAAERNVVPVSVWLLLLFVSISVCWIAGFTTSLGESNRMVISMVLLPILIALVITIIADLGSQRRGLISISQQSMVNLQETLRKYHDQSSWTPGPSADPPGEPAPTPPAE